MAYTSNLKGKPLLAAITLSSGMGFILFGYDDGVMGGILTATSFEDQFHLDSSMEGTVTAIFAIGCFLGCLLTSANGDRFGRTRLAHAGTIVLCVGAVLQASSYQVSQLIVGRIVAGVGLGLTTSNISIWQSETAPPRWRGMLLACSLSFLILGQLIAYWLDYGVNNYSGSFSWRFPVAFQAFIALLTSVMFLFVPESPRWLMKHDRIEEATTVVRNLQLDTSPGDGAVSAEIANIREAIMLEHHSSKGWLALLKSDNVGSRRRVGLAVLINAMQPFSGSTPISYYTTVIFEDSVGFSRHMSLLMSGFLQIWFLIASLATWYLIEHAGRRRMFLFSALGMAASMTILGIMLAIDTTTSGIVAAVMIFAYQAFYTWGYMGGVWVYGPEILPLEYRSKGTGLAVSALWIFSFMITEIVPTCIANIGWKTYIMFAVFNLCFVPIVYFLFPETSGFGLETVDLCFMDPTKSPVKRAAELQAMRKKGEDITLVTEIEGTGKDILADGLGAQHLETVAAKANNS